MIRFVSGEAGVPSARGFHVLGWEADHASSHLLRGRKI